MRSISIVRKQYQVFSILLVALFCIGFLFIMIPGTGISEEPPEPNQPQISLTSGPDKKYLISELGETLYYNFELKNEGNLPETIQIEVGAEDGGEISLDGARDSSVTLSKGETEPISVEIVLPKGAANREYKFYINVTSKNTVPYQKFIYAVVSQQEIFITGALKPILIITPSKDKLGTISAGEKLEVTIKVNNYVVSANDVYLEYKVLKLLDNRETPEKNLIVSIDPESHDIDKRESKVFTLTIELPDDFNSRANYTTHLEISAKAHGYDNTISPPITLNFMVHHEPKKQADSFAILSSPIAIVGISSLFIIGAIGAAIGSNEVSKFAFLSLVFVPLYTKLHKNKILDHFTRGRVYEHIRNNPGVHYSEIKRELDLNNGSLAYHLHTLEREELIRSRTSGRYKLFFPTDVKIPKDMEPQISSIRRQILEIIRETPGIKQQELGQKLPNKKQRTISYHVKTMSREGVLRLERDGRETRCYITDNVIEIKQHGVVFKEVEEEDSASKYSDSVIRQI